MRGITPVIAIILLLLMAVAAAGGFYFVYQQFSQSGEESGSSQIDTLGEQALSQIKIESAAGGRIYIRNTGATTIDASKLSVFVENVPVSVNRSSDTLAENSRATLKLTQVPTCTREKCEVKVSGAASTTQTIDLAKLICSTDNDCVAGESCEGGICVGGEVECGDGVCSAGEYGYTCWEDCGLRSMLLYAINFSSGDGYQGVFEWNGTSYQCEENLTDSSVEGQWLAMPAWKSDGTGTGVSYYGDDNNRDLWFSEYDGSSWSYPVNMTQGPSPKSFFFGGSDANSTGGTMVVWRGMQGYNDFVHWATIINGQASPLHRFDFANAPGQAQAFAFEDNDDGYLFWTNESNVGGTTYEVSYLPWENSAWGTPGSLYSDNNQLSVDLYGLDFYDGEGMVMWRVENQTNWDFIKYATYDGSSWTHQGNVDSWEQDNNTKIQVLSLKYDHTGVPLMSVVTSTGGPPDATRFSRYTNSAWGSFFNFEGDPQTQTLLMNTLDNTLYTYSVELGPFFLGEWQYTYSVWNGNAWGIERRWMETYP